MTDTTEPTATGEPDPTATADDVNGGTVQQDMGTRQLEVRNPYDVAVPETLRERIAYARALAQAGVLPKDYARNPANVLVAGELGRELGLTNVQAVLMLNVVEGRPSLGASGVRATILRAGHRIKVTDRAYSAHGFPTAVTVTGWRYDDAESGEPADTDARTYTLDMAHRAGLVDQVRRDDAGEVVSVVARSQYGKVKPWEAHTERMLEARATTWVGDTLFADVTMGLSVDRDPEPAATVTTAEQVAAPGAEPTPRAQAVLDRLPAQPSRRTDLPDDYDPAEDVDYIVGSTQGDTPWWEHAGAQVARRSKVQLAADRLARYVADNPDQDTVPVPREPGDDEHDATVDVDPTVTPNGDAADEPDGTVDAEVVEDVPEPDAPTDPEPTMDPNDPDDPWSATAAARHDVPAEDVPAPDTETDALPTDLPPADDPTVDDGPDLGDDGPDLSAEPTAADLLAVIDAAAAELGKSRTTLMVRWVSTHRKNPADATADELRDFVDKLQPLLEAARRSGA